MADLGPTPTPGTVLVANPSADLYGSDRMMLETVRGLVGLGWRVVVTCSGDGPLIAELEAAGAQIRILSVPVIRKSMLSPRGLVGLAGQALGGLLRMRRLIKAERPDVLLVNTVTIPFWLVAARWCRRPSVVHVHEAERSLSRVARFGLTAPLALANRVIFNSEVSRGVSSLNVLERSHRVQVISNGVSGPPAVVPAREQLDEPFRVIYVGRLSPRKGVDLVVRALPELAEQGVVAELDLVGSVFPGYEWYEAELRELVATLHLGSRIHFQGFQADIWPFLERADVAVVPSRLDESFGNTVIEALLAARPVIVSDHTGLREAAAGFEAAVLTPINNVTALASGLRTVHERWSQFRARAQRDEEVARQRYGPPRFHRALGITLSELKRNRRSGSRTSPPAKA